MKPPIATPRTDAEIHRSYPISGNFARQLERELKASQAEVERLKANIRRAIEIAEVLYLAHGVECEHCPDRMTELDQLKETLNQDNK